MVQTKGETLRDRHNRAMREAAGWYRERVSSAPHPPDIVLWTMDTDCQTHARAAGLVAPSLEEFTERYVEDKTIIDLIAWCAWQTLCKLHVSSRELPA